MRRQVERGATFTEILLAIIVFLVASAGITGAYLACHQLSEHATNTMRAVSDLDDIVERIYATPFANVQAVFPAGVPNGGVANPYAASVGGYTLADEQITVTYPAQATGRLEVLVTLNWTHRGRVRTTQVSTIRTKS